MEQLTKEHRRKIYEQALYELDPASDDALCLYHFNKHFDYCKRDAVHYGCNQKPEYGTGSLVEFELFTVEEGRLFFDFYRDNDARIFALQLCIEMCNE